MVGPDSNSPLLKAKALLARPHIIFPTHVYSPGLYSPTPLLLLGLFKRIDSIYVRAPL
jgi:hypothetical protein